MPSKDRVILMLQGPHGPFLPSLVKSLRLRGVRCVRVILNTGDWCGFNLPENVRYHGNLANFRFWVSELMAAERVTDLLVYGDCRPYHREALSLQSRFKFRSWVLEEGYVRPYWVTLEPNGVNGHSDIPRLFNQWLATTDVDKIDLEEAEIHRPVGRGLRGLVFWCHVYYLLRLFGTFLYPRYRSHRPDSYVLEAVSWLRKLSKRLLGRYRRSDQFVRSILSSGQPFYFVPLQIDADAQIIFHSRFGNMKEFLAEVLHSFQAHAPVTSNLVIKAHPLDSEINHYGRFVRRQAKQLGIENRVYFLYTGAIPELLKQSEGVITVNSTVGFQAIHHGCPTLVLGEAIYKHQSLVNHLSLDDFWLNASRPNRIIYRQFRYFVIKYCQINGNFFSIRGRKLLVDAIADRLASAEPEALQTLSHGDQQIVMKQQP